MTAVGITTSGVSKRLGRTQALDGVSLEFAAGGLNGLIGPDGAGKTTLMRILAGLLRPDQGSVAFSAGGRKVPFAEVRPTMAYMPQRPSLYPDLSVAEHLEFFRDLYGLAPEVYAPRAAELLSVTRLEPFRDRRASQLSGGMYKKLGLMCCLLQSPTALLLDEPTNGVDPISRREFWDLLYRLASRRVLIVISTAYMDEAERCSKVHLLDDGRVLSSGEPAALLAAEGAAGFHELFLRRADARRP
ncbi:MAG: ABC transporter ATP-binding protein [Elusimicrobia bacterium]|nr:ABC transporter ATP-binding protein [Elusimicrobiota bacterium]